MTMNWWEADEWAKARPMEFLSRDKGRTVRIIDNTDPELYRTPQGALRLRLVPVQRPKARIFTGSNAWLTR